MYYLFNKESNRVAIECKHLPLLLSGVLGNELVTSVKPKEFSYWEAKWKGWCYGCTPIKVKVEPISKLDDYFRGGYTYIWLQRVDGTDTTIYKVTNGVGSSENYLGENNRIYINGGWDSMDASHFNNVIF